MASGGLRDRIRWFLLAEALIFLWSMAGPGYRHAMVQDAEPGVVARVFFDDPTFVQAVAVNAVGLHLFVGGVILVVWVVGRIRGER